MTEEETMHKFFKYVKEEFPSLIYAILNTAKAAYKPMAANINRCAINQRNWRMYRVDLGGKMADTETYEKLYALWLIANVQE